MAGDSGSMGSQMLIVRCHTSLTSENTVTAFFIACVKTVSVEDMCFRKVRRAVFQVVVGLSRSVFVENVMESHHCQHHGKGDTPDYVTSNFPSNNHPFRGADAGRTLRGQLLCGGELRGGIHAVTRLHTTNMTPGFRWP